MYNRRQYFFYAVFSLSKQVAQPNSIMLNKNYQLTQVNLITIDEDDSEQRLDNFLFRHFRTVPKSRIYRALRHGEVRINKKRVKPDYRLVTNDVLRIPPFQVEEKPTALPVADSWLKQLENAILLENDDILVINKPSGLAVHGGSGVDYGLIEAMRKLRPHSRRMELCHRLDRDTSGCVIIAKKSSALRAIHKQLREQSIKKYYLALVRGQWPKRKSIVDAPLERYELSNGERMVRVSAAGKESKTLFKVLSSSSEASLIQAMPITGRTHQIRVHALHAGFALAGDNKYCSKDELAWAHDIGLKRLFLHANRVEFTLPNYEHSFSVEAPLSAELQATLNHLEL